jgi:hypothetical protein
MHSGPHAVIPASHVHTPATHELPGVHVPPAAHDAPRSIGGVARRAIDVAQRPSSQTRPASHAV